jgi:hypothetical protein
MKTEFDIGDEVWCGYPDPVKGKITGIHITKSRVRYEIDGRSYWGVITKTEKEARIRGIKSDLETHKRYIAKLEKELEELEK